MKSKILGLIAVGLLVGTAAANAAPVTYDFWVNGGPKSSSPLAGVNASGYFSFDDSLIPASGGGVSGPSLLSDLAFTWNGVSYNASSANTGFLNFDPSGNLDDFRFGTNCSVNPLCEPSAGTYDWYLSPYPAQFWYALGGEVFKGPGGYSLRVPEPGTLALLGLGLAGLGLSRRRKAN